MNWQEMNGRRRLPWGVAPGPQATDHPVLIGLVETALAFAFDPKIFGLSPLLSKQLLLLFWRHCSMPEKPDVNKREVKKRTAEKYGCHGCQGFHSGHLGGRLRG